jgi:hypothetical protein
MRALNVPAAGRQPEVSELSTPEVTDGTVLIKVKAAGLNAIDNGIAAGMLAGTMPHEYPVVIGRDAAGVVAAVGAGGDHVNIGDEVLGHVLLAPPIQAGTLAEYALLPAAAVVAKPAELDFVTAAAIPLAGAPQRPRSTRSTPSPARPSWSTALPAASVPTRCNCSPPATRPWWPPALPRTPTGSPDSAPPPSSTTPPATWPSRS